MGKFIPTTNMRMMKIQFFTVASKVNIQDLLDHDFEADNNLPQSCKAIYGKIASPSTSWGTLFKNKAEAIDWFIKPENPLVMTEALKYKAAEFLDELLDTEHIDEDGNVLTKVASLKMKAAEILLKQDNIVNNTVNIKQNFKFGKHSLEDLNNQLLQLTKVNLLDELEDTFGKQLTLEPEDITSLL